MYHSTSCDQYGSILSSPICTTQHHVINMDPWCQVRYVPLDIMWSIWIHIVNSNMYHSTSCDQYGSILSSPICTTWHHVINMDPYCQFQYVPLNIMWSIWISNGQFQYVPLDIMWSMWIPNWQIMFKKWHFKYRSSQYLPIPLKLQNSSKLIFLHVGLYCFYVTRNFTPFLLVSVYHFISSVIL